MTANNISCRWKYLPNVNASWLYLCFPLIQRYYNNDLITTLYANSVMHSIEVSYCSIKMHGTKFHIIIYKYGPLSNFKYKY